MKRLWIAVAVLCVIFTATLLNSAYLGHFTVHLTDRLAQAERLAESGDWNGAGALTQQVVDDWHSHDNYLYTVLRHSDTDEVHIRFRAVQEFITCQESGEYSAANAELITRIELLHEMEQFSLPNLL